MKRKIFTKVIKLSVEDIFVNVKSLCSEKLFAHSNTCEQNSFLSGGEEHLETLSRNVNTFV